MNQVDYVLNINTNILQFAFSTKLKDEQFAKIEQQQLKFKLQNGKAYLLDGDGQVLLEFKNNDAIGKYCIVEEEWKMKRIGVIKSHLQVQTTYNKDVKDIYKYKINSTNDFLKSRQSELLDSKPKKTRSSAKPRIHKIATHKNPVLQKNQISDILPKKITVIPSLRKGNNIPITNPIINRPIKNNPDVRHLKHRGEGSKKLPEKKKDKKRQKR